MCPRQIVKHMNCYDASFSLQWSFWVRDINYYGPTSCQIAPAKVGILNYNNHINMVLMG